MKQATHRILRLADVQRVTGLRHSALYEAIARGQFPKQVRLTAKAVGWVESEVDDWLAARIAERDGAVKRSEVS